MKLMLRVSTYATLRTHMSREWRKLASRETRIPLPIESVNQGKSLNKHETLPKGFVRITDMWTDPQKERNKQHEEEIQKGYKDFSAY